MKPPACSNFIPEPLDNDSGFCHNCGYSHAVHNSEGEEDFPVQFV